MNPIGPLRTPACAIDSRITSRCPATEGAVQPTFCAPSLLTEMGGSAPPLEGRRGNAELFLESGRKVARVRVAEVCSHHGHRGVASAQAPTRFMHALSLEQPIDTFVEQ
jgi:hypothetical protein